jgi:ribonuclease P protein subunit POP4
MIAKMREIEVHELIGLSVKVVKAASLDLVGVSGVVVDETKNTLVVQTKSGGKIVPKEGSTFEFQFRGKSELLDGGRICFRPEDRLKKVKKG